MTISLIPKCFAMLRGNQDRDLFYLPTLPLDKKVPDHVLERRGAISFGSPTSPNSEKTKCRPRLSRRGGVSVDAEGVEAKYLRLLGEAVPCPATGNTITEFTVKMSLKDLGKMQKQTSGVAALSATTQDDPELSDNVYPGRFKRKLSAPTVSSHRVNDGIEWSQLNRISFWDFDTLSIARISKGKCLYYIGLQILMKHDLFDEFNLDIMSVLKFLNLLEHYYVPDNPFHNAVHAADVCQAMHCLLVNLRSIDTFKSYELLACVLAAMAHDVNHPGVNQNFLIKTASHLMKINGNDSLLEQHHSKVSKSLIKESGIIAHLSPQLQNDILELVEDLIMATDMAQHQNYMNNMKKLIAAGYNPQRKQDRRIVLRFAMKCSDLCNTARPWSTCVQWGKLVLEEFWRQGDQEKSLMLDVNNMFDRDVCVPSKALTGFIDFIAEPMFTLWADFCDTPFTRDICRQIDNNRSHWEDIVKLPERHLTS